MQTPQRLGCCRLRDNPDFTVFSDGQQVASTFASASQTDAAFGSSFVSLKSSWHSNPDHATQPVNIIMNKLVLEGPPGAYKLDAVLQPYRLLVANGFDVAAPQTADAPVPAFAPAPHNSTFQEHVRHASQPVNTFHSDIPGVRSAGSSHTTQTGVTADSQTTETTYSGYSPQPASTVSTGSRSSASLNVTPQKDAEAYMSPLLIFAVVAFFTFTTGFACWAIRQWCTQVEVLRQLCLLQWPNCAA